MSAMSTSRSPSGSRPARSRATPIPSRSSISASCKATSTCRNDPGAEGRDLRSIVAGGGIDQVVGEVLEPCLVRQLDQSTAGDVVGDQSGGQQSDTLAGED